LKGNNRVECLYLLRSWLPELERWFVQVQEGFPGQSDEEELEEFLVKLMLLIEGKLVESLVDLKLLTEVKMNSSLVKLELLLERGVIESLVKLKFLLEGKMFGPLVNLDLKHVEEKKSPQVDSPIFLLQMTNRGSVPV
jgi:hypothetical protein